MIDGFQVPAVEDDFGRTGRPVLPGPHRDEQQVRRGAQPDAAEPDGDAGQVRPLVPEDGPLVEVAVAVGVLEDQDAVAALGRG
jgi:hypothetical protein